MNKEKLNELAKSYVESRIRATQVRGCVSMMNVCNENAQRTVNKAMELGYTTDQWNQAVQEIWDEQHNRDGGNI